MRRQAAATFTLLLRLLSSLFSGPASLGNRFTHCCQIKMSVRKQITLLLLFLSRGSDLVILLLLLMLFRAACSLGTMEHIHTVSFT